MSVSDKVLKRLERTELVLLFLVGIIILFIRSAYTVSCPTIYTEDGTWMGMILTNGFWDTLLHAKATYLVFGNIIMLGISLALNTLFCGDNLNYLPHFVTLVHYIFYSLVALLPVICFKYDLQKKIRILVWFLILTVPLGGSAFEIMGKISNTGYVVYVIAYCLLHYRVFHRTKMTVAKVIAIDVGLFLCCTTHPGCFVLVGLAFILDAVMQYKELQMIEHRTVKELLKGWMKIPSNISWIILGILCCLAAGYIKLFLDFESQEPITLFAGGVYPTIEFFARCLLFYIVYPIYTHLNDPIVVLLFIMVLATIIFVYAQKAIDKREKLILTLSLVVTIIYFLMTMIGRGGMIIPALNKYTTSWVDRYYYGLNITTLIPMAFVLQYLLKTGIKPAKYLSYTVAAWLLCCPFINPSYIFQYTNANTSSTHVVPFKDRIFQISYDPTSDICVVPIDFEGWTMQINEGNYWASVQNLRHMTPLTASNVTDSNWEKGVGIQPGVSNIILFDRIWYSTLQNSSTLSVGDQVVNIIEVRDNGQWIHVVCDSEDLGAFAYPNEITFAPKGA